MTKQQELTSSQLDQYRRDGFTVMRALLNQSECEDFIRHMMDLHSGTKRIEGFEPRQSNDWGRTHNQHRFDPRAMSLLLDPRLRRPLAQCLGDEPDAVQTMYFWVGSEQRRHQDSFYLPSCMSAWIALVDVGPHNGTIWVQPGSHKGRLITGEDLKVFAEQKQTDPGACYNDAVDELFRENALPEVPVEVNAGDAVLFHGVLIHRGGPIGQPGSFRHVMANHYIPRAFSGWPHKDWPRISFDGEFRYAT